MRISRSYVLGLGSGLILSALIAVVIPPVSIDLAGDLPTDKVSPAENLSGSESQGGDANQGGSGNEGGSEANTNSEPNAQLTKVFVIPSGSTADNIAELLLVGKWISSKEEFIDLVEERNLASRFRAGSFELTQGMDVEEILEQLIPN